MSKLSLSILVLLAGGLISTVATANVFPITPSLAVSSIEEPGPSPDYDQSVLIDEPPNPAAAQVRRCAAKLTVGQVMHSLRTGAGKNTIPVAHRGLFLSATPSKMAAENSWKALQNAACAGYWAVEVDLRLLSDGTVILMHDDSPSRTTNIDSANGVYQPGPHAQVKDANGKLLRNMRWNASRLNTAFTRSTFLSALKFQKIYRDNGNYYARNNLITGEGNLIFLDTFLSNVKNTPEMSSQVIVLDIQNYAVFKRTYAIVKRLNMFDRVVFKLWSEAVPISKIGEGSPKLYLEDIDNGAPIIGSYVFASNATNTRWNSTTGNWELKFHSVFAGRDDWYVYEDFPATQGYGNANIFISQLRNADRTVPGFALIGYEFVIGATADKAQVDRFLRARQSDVYAQTPVRPVYSQTWGVDRGVDYVRRNCVAGVNCSQFPNGLYGAWTDTLYDVPAAVRNSRNAFGRESIVVVRDVIY